MVRDMAYSTFSRGKPLRHPSNGSRLALAGIAVPSQVLEAGSTTVGHLFHFHQKDHLFNSFHLRTKLVMKHRDLFVLTNGCTSCGKRAAEAILILHFTELSYHTNY